MLALATRLFRTVVVCLTFRPALAYMVLSANRSGFLRDALLLLACTSCGVPVVGHLRGGNFGHFHARAPRWLRVVIATVVPRFHRIILLAERFRPHVEGLIAPSRVAVLYNGVEATAFDACATRTDRADGLVTVLYLGHLSVAKGFGDALELIPRVLAHVPHVRFEFAGEWLLRERNVLVDEQGRPLPDGGDLEARFAKLAARYPDNIRLLGVIEGTDKLEALRRADIFLFPSYSEGFPMAVLEAMAAGLPLVATPVGALGEVLTDGIHGYLVEPGDVEGFARALTALAGAPQVRERMGNTNRDQVRNRFSVDAVVSALARQLRAWAEETAFGARA
ncbi:MAG: glycosyltransferase family 4 protein [Vicinamibacterales bacterium]